MSKTEINFLDTTVFKVDNKLRTKLYVKPTNIQSYLHSHALRFNKICYNRSDLHNNCKRLLNTSIKQILQHKSTVLLQFQEMSY